LSSTWFGLAFPEADELRESEFEAFYEPPPTESVEALVVGGQPPKPSRKRKGQRCIKVAWRPNIEIQAESLTDCVKSIYARRSALNDHAMYCLSGQVSIGGGAKSTDTQTTDSLTELVLQFL